MSLSVHGDDARFAKKEVIVLYTRRAFQVVLHRVREVDMWALIKGKVSKHTAHSQCQEIRQPVSFIAALWPAANSQAGKYKSKVSCQTRNLLTNTEEKKNNFPIE